MLERELSCSEGASKGQIDSRWRKGGWERGTATKGSGQSSCRKSKRSVVRRRRQKRSMVSMERKERTGEDKVARTEKKGRMDCQWCSAVEDWPGQAWD